MSEYSQTRSFNLGIAEETSIEAALIYDDLAYAQKVFGEGYFFRSDEQMMKRFPMFSKSTLRRHMARLIEGGWISTKVKKMNGKPTRFVQIEHSLIVNLNKTKEIVNLNISYNIETKKKLKGKEPYSFGAVANNNSPISAAPAHALLEKIISIVNPKEKVTAERIRVLNGRLKDYSEQEIVESATAFSKSVWHKENKRMSIDYLLAPTKFGTWYAQRIPEETHKAPTEEERIAEQKRLEEKRKEMMSVFDDK